jgi:CRP-like cAMP-binding protein
MLSASRLGSRHVPALTRREDSMAITMDPVESIRQAPLFAAMPPAVVDLIARAATSVTVAATTPIFARGDDGDSMYIVASGLVRIHDGDMVLNDLGPGAAFGEMAVLDREQRSASATALTTTTLVRLSCQHLIDLVEAEGAVARAMIEMLSHRLRQRVQDKADDFRYLQQVAQLTAAAQALEAGRYRADLLGTVRQREDALGHLARVFDRMAGEVQAREERLQQQVRALSLEIDRSRQTERVREITSSDYFQRLKAEAASLRQGIDGD